MNWGVRIAVILVILGGLVWLNWERFSDESMALVDNDLLAPVFETNTIGQAEGIPASQDTESDQDEGDAYEEHTETEPSKLPEFVLQATPESLNDSDTQVRSVAEEISPETGEWLKPEEQLRKWTLLVAQAAEGHTLYTNRPFTFKLVDFALEERDERYFISPQNFERYAAVVNVLANIPADKLVAYYRDWYPLLDNAFSELGLTGSFDERVDLMIERILAVKVIVLPIELKKPTSVTYKFLDPELESASQIDKLLWRMGPENTRKIQDFASRLKSALRKN